ncbi:MAG: cytoplasmic protein [Actinotalea sp.]|jgi:hypothetical protein|nr:cytoplasmic protein [Actinotalea sp.]
MDLDPVVTNPEHYRVVFENERVRVLEYRDVPGHVSVAHEHPDSVMVTLSAFERRLHRGEQSVDVSLDAGFAGWLPAQRHHGENTGTTATHAIFVELKDDARPAADGSALGPS